jgi:hypothetical protein
VEPLDLGGSSGEPRVLSVMVVVSDRDDSGGRCEIFHTIAPASGLRLGAVQMDLKYVLQVSAHR